MKSVACMLCTGAAVCAGRVSRFFHPSFELDAACACAPRSPRTRRTACCAPLRVTFSAAIGPHSKGAVVMAFLPTIPWNDVDSWLKCNGFTGRVPPGYVVSSKERKERKAWKKAEREEERWIQRKMRKYCQETVEKLEQLPDLDELAKELLTLSCPETMPPETPPELPRQQAVLAGM